MSLTALHYINVFKQNKLNEQQGECSSFPKHLLSFAWKLQRKKWYHFKSSKHGRPSIFHLYQIMFVHNLDFMVFEWNIIFRMLQSNTYHIFLFHFVFSLAQSKGNPCKLYFGTSSTPGEMSYNPRKDRDLMKDYTGIRYY